METRQYAPVYISTLSRYEHFKRCLESLEHCTDADKTDVYVGLDYPPSEKYVDGWKKIDQYLQEKEKNNGFNNLYVRRRDHNCGVGNANSNGALLLKEVRQVSDRYIMTEDDNEFSPDFLTYCNWGLEYFKDDDRILAICGYNVLQTPDLKNNLYIYNKAYCAWGVALWVERRDKIAAYYNYEQLKKTLESYPFSIVFSDKVILASSILRMIKKKHVNGDTVLQLLPDEEKWCVFPKLSMVRNWGHDGSGLHGGTKKSFDKHVSLPIDEATVFKPDIEEDLFSKEIEQAYKAKYGHNSTILRIRSVCRFLVYKLTGYIIVLERPVWLK